MLKGIEGLVRKTLEIKKKPALLASLVLDFSCTYGELTETALESKSVAPNASSAVAVIV